MTEDEQKQFDEIAKADGAKPEVKAEVKAEEKPVEKVEAKAEEKKDPPVVPKAALDQARIENKDLRKELEAMRSVVADGDRKLREMLDKIEKKADAPPKFEDDPAANLKHKNEQLEKDLAAIREKVEKQDKATENAGKLNDFRATVDAKEAAFAKEHADYWEAAKFLQEAWKDELSEAGFEEAEIPKLVIGKALGITGKALQAGKDPAQTIYNLAKRIGYAVPKPEAGAEKKPAKKEDGESKLKTIEKGQELAKTNGGAGGPEESTLSSLAQMDNDQLDRVVADEDWWAKNIRRSPLH